MSDTPEKKENIPSSSPEKTEGKTISFQNTQPKVDNPLEERGGQEERKIMHPWGESFVKSIPSRVPPVDRGGEDFAAHLQKTGEVSEEKPVLHPLKPENQPTVPADGREGDVKIYDPILRKKNAGQEEIGSLQPNQGERENQKVILNSSNYIENELKDFSKEKEKATLNSRAEPEVSEQDKVSSEESFTGRLKRAQQTHAEFDNYQELSEVLPPNNEKEKVSKKETKEVGKDATKKESARSSLLQLKEPKIVVETPKQEEKVLTPPPPKVPETPKEKLKRTQPLLKLQENKLDISRKEEEKSQGQIAYEEIFDLENLPPPRQEIHREEKPEEELEELPPDHPLYEIMESLKNPLPNDPYSKQVLDKNEDKPTKTVENEFEQRMRQVAEGTTLESTAQLPKLEETVRPVAPRTPYKEETPWEMLYFSVKDVVEWVGGTKKGKKESHGEGNGFSEEDSKGKKEKLFPLPYDDKEKQYKMVMMIVGLSVFIGLFSTFLYMMFQSDSTVVSVVQLDVNPSIQISLSSSQKVVEVKAMNQQALSILGSIDFLGKSLEETVDSITGLLLLYDYVQDSSTLLVTVQDNKKSRGEEVSVLVKQYIDYSLIESASYANSVGLWVDPEFDYAEQATEEGISLGKMVLINEIMKVNPFFPLSDLKEFTQGELFQVYALNSSVLPIGMSSAVELARQAVLLSDSDTYTTTVQIRLTDETPNYFVQFQTPTKNFDVEVQGFQGNVLTSMESVAFNANPEGGVIPSQAKATALSYVGITEGQTDNLRIDQDWSKGRLSYLVTFQVKDTYHTVSIFAATGVVDDHQKTQVEGSQVKDLGQSAIQEVVFEDAGVTKSQLGSIALKQRLEGDILIYSVVFWVSNRQYAYEVQGDGTIIDYQFEDFGDEAAKEEERNLYLVSETNAKDLALEHAGLNFSQVNNLTVTLNESQNYNVDFYLENNLFRYEVSGETGAVLFYEKEEAAVEWEPEEDVGDIGQEAALEILLANNNLKAAMMQGLTITLEGSGWDKVYKMEYSFLGVKFYYTISAVSGEIMDVQSVQPEVNFNLPQEEYTPPQSYEDILNNMDSIDHMFEAFDNNFNSEYD